MFDISHNITSGKYELVYGEYGRVATTIQKYSTEKLLYFAEKIRKGPEMKYFSYIE